MVHEALSPLRGSPAVDHLVGAMIFSLWRPFPKPIYVYGAAVDKVMAAFALSELGGRSWSELRADGIPFDMRRGEWFVISHPMVLEDLIPRHRPALLKKELRRTLDGLELSAAMGRRGELVEGVPPATIMTGDLPMFPELRDRVFSVDLRPDLDRVQYSKIVSGQSAGARVELGRRVQAWLRESGASSTDDYLDMWSQVSRVPEVDRSCVAACQYGLRLLDTFLDAHGIPFQDWPRTRALSPDESPEGWVPGADSPDVGLGAARPDVTRRSKVSQKTPATVAPKPRQTMVGPKRRAGTPPPDPTIVARLADALQRAIAAGRVHFYDLHGPFEVENAKSGRRIGVTSAGRILLQCAAARAVLADASSEQAPNSAAIAAALEAAGLLEKDEAGSLSRTRDVLGRSTRVWDLPAAEFWAAAQHR